MNITELARKLKITTKELKQKLPELGFDIGMKAIKVDEQIAQKIIQAWPELIKKFKKIETKEEKEEIKPKEEAIITIPPFITVHDFASSLNLPPAKVISELIKNGVLANINERIDYEIAAIVAEDLGFKVKKGTEEVEIKEKKREEIKKLIKKENKSKLILRPPVVAVMGHVDHGKTKLLDAIRETNVADKETGGITQHIGAYQIKKKERVITFIDTPGHEAFKTMRTRGGEVADIVVLVIAADEGIKPQTLESIKIIQEEKLPFLIAINKIDKPEADTERVKKELSEINLMPEDWGGKTICLKISAKTKEGLDELLEMILLLTDLEKEQLLVDPAQEPIGTVIEAHLDKNEGPVATVLIQAGTLKIKNLVVVGGIYGGTQGKIKALKDFQNQPIKRATPGMPVKILGLKKVPKTGDILQGLENIKELKRKIKEIKIKQTSTPVEIQTKSSSKEEKVKFLNIILRTDVLGSQEAISGALENIKHPEIKINIIKKGLGNILETDILRAETITQRGDKVWIVGFHVIASPQIITLAKEKNIEIKTYKIIYELIEDVKNELVKLLEPERIKTELGKVEVIALFRKEKNYQIVGGKIKEGRVLKDALAEIYRKEKIINKGIIKQLQITRQDVGEARAGSECGLKIEGQNLNIQMGDVLEIYQEEERIKKLED